MAPDQETTQPKTEQEKLCEEQRTIWEAFKKSFPEFEIPSWWPVFIENEFKYWLTMKGDISNYPSCNKGNIFPAIEKFPVICFAMFEALGFDWEYRGLYNSRCCSWLPGEVLPLQIFHAANEKTGQVVMFGCDTPYEALKSILLKEGEANA